MPENTHRVNKLTSLHKQLSAICDTGFAIAAHIRYTRPSLLYQTYARKWSEHYSEKGYMLCDPVVIWVLPIPDGCFGIRWLIRTPQACWRRPARMGCTTAGPMP